MTHRDPEPNAFDASSSGEEGLRARVRALEAQLEAQAVQLEAQAVQLEAQARRHAQSTEALALREAILGETPAVIYAKDQDLRFLLSNARHAALIGRPSESIVGLTDRDLFGDEAGDVEELSRAVLSSGAPQVSEFDLTVQNDLRTYHELIFPLRTPDGTLRGLGGIATDITENRRNQRKLEALRTTFERILADSPVALLLLDTAGRIGLANAAARAIFDGEALQGVAFETLVPSVSFEELDAALAAREDVVASGVPVEGRSRPVRELGAALDVELRLREGVSRPAELRASRIELPQGEAVLVSLVDLTIRKETENALAAAKLDAEAAAGAKGRFLAHMSHEIRTPMNAVLGFAQLLAGDPSLGPGQRARVQTILRAGDHLLTLVNQVLDMSVIESGHLEILDESVELPAFVQAVLEMFSGRAAQTRTLLQAAFDASVPPVVLADGGKLRQILVNLLGNAVRMTPGGTVTLRVDTAEREGRAWLLFLVQDTGPGISEANLERIFGAFEQAGSAAQRGGAGLGLSISRKYAELFGGRLTARSELGHGATFELQIPLRAAPPPRLASSMPSLGAPGMTRRTLRLLVVDDEEHNRTLMAEMLAAPGVTVVCAASGEEGLQAVRASAPDAIVMDYRMPGMDGLQTTSALRALDPPFEGPILILSASVFEDLERLSAEHGAGAYLRKPVRQQDLLRALYELLGLQPPQRPSFVGSAEVQDGAPASPLPPISEALKARLRDAVEACDYGGLVALAREIEASHPALSKVAAQAATRFHYDDLLAMLD